MSNFKDGKAKSKCRCGHVGDGVWNSVHSGSSGHAACMALKCPCQQFTWASWTAEYAALLDRAAK